MVNGEDCQKAENQVLECANYLINNPIEIENANQNSAVKFLVGWMTVTPDYKFGLNPTVMEAIKDNTSLTGIYMACMCKYAIDNKNQPKDDYKLEMNSIKMFLDYCGNPSNNVTLSEKLNELIKANKEDKLKNQIQIFE